MYEKNLVHTKLGFVRRLVRSGLCGACASALCVGFVLRVCALGLCAGLVRSDFTLVSHAELVCAANEHAHAYVQRHAYADA